MLCPDCKTKVPEKYTYCPKCGASIPLYRMDRHNVNRFVPMICGVIAVGGLGSLAVLSGIRTRNAIPQTTAAAEKPAAEAAAPEEPDVPKITPAEEPAPEGSDVIPFSESAVIVDHVSAFQPKYAPHSGDVNGDGSVDVIDAQMILADYTECMSGKRGLLTDEQRVSGAVTSDASEPSAADAQTILRYYAACLSDSSLRETGIQEWYSAQRSI